MGISMGLQAASDKKIDELAKDANALDNFISLGGNEESANGDALRAMIANGSALQGGLLDFLGIGLKNGQNLGPSLDLGKSYHGLHYLFTGSPDQGREPQCFLLHGGRVIGTYQREFQVRAITSIQLAAFVLAIQPIDEDELMRRYNGKAMIAADIHPAEMWEDDGGRSYLIRKSRDLMRFLRTTQDRNEGMIMCVR